MRASFFGIVLLLLSGCGPQYDVRYVYTPPPDSPETRQCLQGCDFQRQQCLLINDNNYQFCQLEAQNEAYRCEADARYYYSRCLDRNEDNPERCRYQRAFCPRRACLRDERRCDELYRSCYAACGGSISSETVCTSNCDEIPAPAVP